MFAHSYKNPYNYNLKCEQKQGGSLQNVNCDFKCLLFKNGAAWQAAVLVLGQLLPFSQKNHAECLVDHRSSSARFFLVYLCVNLPISVPFETNLRMSSHSRSSLLPMRCTDAHSRPICASPLASDLFIPSRLKFPPSLPQVIVYDILRNYFFLNILSNLLITPAAAYFVSLSSLKIYALLFSQCKAAIS